VMLLLKIIPAMAPSAASAMIAENTNAIIAVLHPFLLSIL
jgi:hypothetical protein